MNGKAAHVKSRKVVPTIAWEYIQSTQDSMEIFGRGGEAETRQAGDF